MFKTVHDNVWAYDVEWVPDATAGKVLYDLHGSDLTEEEVLSVMWKKGGATDEMPTPFLKTVMCRVVSIAVVQRKATERGVSLALLSLPRKTSDTTQASESHVLHVFLDALGSHCPQLVGYNSSDADLKILIQRAVVHGLAAERFCRRPDKPWEGVDYFARDSEWNVDLMRILGGWGKSTPSLHEIATLSGIPGKLGIDGGDVAAMWLRREHQRIVDYNECDAVTTYLVWLRMAYFGGKFTAGEYEQEQQRMRDLLESECATSGKEHLGLYLKEWDRLRAIVGRGSMSISVSAGLGTFA
jgi:predicted PolB exonuclease-like 3'-5' exonuclease